MTPAQHKRLLALSRQTLEIARQRLAAAHAQQRACALQAAGLKADWEREVRAAAKDPSFAASLEGYRRRHSLEQEKNRLAEKACRAEENDARGALKQALGTHKKRELVFARRAAESQYLQQRRNEQDSEDLWLLSKQRKRIG